ncbi:MAG: (Fe-S)-binding protein [Bacteroidia bacterium]|nr:(Fe-S)-binding protein [Bacteroidia bacterium]
MISSLLFIILLAASVFWFSRNASKIRRNILLGKEYTPEGTPAERWKNMALVALGQSKMVSRPLSGILHIFVYAGFVLINIEVLEIILDGIFNTHRIFHGLGKFYDFLIAFFEILALLVFISVVIFWARRNVLKLPRFTSPELKGWPLKDANIILITEMVLMSALLCMNACDQILQSRGVEHYVRAGAFPISSLILPLFDGMSDQTLVFLERFGWWAHIIGIFAFLNYLPYSKHLHIILAFPNTYYSPQKPMGTMELMEQVKDVVAPNFIPDYQPLTDPNQPGRFGAKDVFDLTWKNLLDAYTCTECGRCTSSCPQNLTGKKLSPRKIMMDTRDRLEEVGKNIDQNGGKFADDGKSLLGDYILPEEVWACNTCQACVQECPVNINPLDIILKLRRYMLMEESKNPSEWTNMFTNLENNGAPWQFSPADRAKWVTENA